MRFKQSLFFALTLCLVYLGATAQAQADPLTLTLNQQEYTVTPGSKIIFGGTVTNPHAALFSITTLGFITDTGPTGVFPIWQGFGPVPDQLMPTLVAGLGSASGNLFEFDLLPDAPSSTREQRRIECFIQAKHY
jgi:hypothetical protein